MDEPVHLFPTCLLEAFSPDTAVSAGRVLEDAGCSVAVDHSVVCCGQPALNLGHRREARRVAARLLAAHRDTTGPIVVPSGSCATTMAKLYPALFADTPLAEEAERFAARVREWSSFLVHDLGYTPPKAVDAPAVALHASCHGLRELDVRDEPRRLLERAGVPLVDLPAAEECCGFGGAFSVLLPEASAGIMATKLDNVERAQAAGAAVVGSLDAGCLMHMQGGHERRVSNGGPPCPRYRHVADLLAAHCLNRSAEPPEER